MDRKPTADTESPSHQRPPFSDPLAGRVDPTSPGAPHEPGGVDYRQSESEERTPKRDRTLDKDDTPR